VDSSPSLKHQSTAWFHLWRDDAISTGLHPLLTVATGVTGTTTFAY
jgi:hypothetical protein